MSGIDIRVFAPAALRKAKGIPNRTLSRILGLSASQRDFELGSPVLGNSVPKSGTHLLLQILRSLPCVRYFDGFMASAPSRRHVERPLTRQLGMIGQVAPREVIPSHLFFSNEVSGALRARHFVHFFIYRDPRDVVISEAHYLTSSATHHGLHADYARCNNFEERLELAIRGIDPPRDGAYYPDVATRFGRYKQWIADGNVQSVRYEELREDGLTGALRRIVSFYRERANHDFDIDEAAGRARKAIAPERSHTFRSGQIQQWKTEFSRRNKDSFKQIAGQLLIELGYEKDLDW